MDSLILPHMNEMAERYPNERIVMILDGAGWHRGGELTEPANMRPLPLPPYAPECNPVEHMWGELREKHFHNRVFDSLDALEDQLEYGLRDLEQHPDTVQSITAWDWIITIIMNAN